MSLTANYWANNSKPNHGKAYILAQGCMLAFDITQTANLQAYQAAIGADSYETFPPTGWTPGAIVWKYNSGTLVLTMAGSTSVNQAMVYGLSRDLMPSVIPGPLQYVSGFYNQNYANVSKITTYIQNPQQHPQPINLVIAGFSLGGAFSRMILTDLLQNHATAITCLGGYSFGCPAFASQGFDAVIDSNYFVYSYRHKTDPVPTFTRRDQTNFFVNAENRLCSRINRWNMSGTKLQMRDGDIAEVTRFDDDNRGLLATAADVGNLTTRGNFTHHPLSAYIDYFERYLRRGRVIHGMPGLRQGRELIEAVRNVPTGTDPQMEDNSDWSGDSGVQEEWNGNIPVPGNFMEQLPIVQVPGVGTGRVVIRPSSSYYEPARSRQTTQRGDGHAKKACLEILEKIAHIRHHDSNVSNGVHRGTNFLFGSNTVPENLLSSIDTIEDTLRRLIN